MKVRIVRSQIYLIVAICTIIVIALLIFSSTSRHTLYMGFGSGPLEFIINDSAVDPTWNELQSFLILDHTDSIVYVENEFVCSNYAERLKNNAENAGIKAAYVYVEFDGCQFAHAINAFNTTDRGLVFIDCTGTDNGNSGDRIVTVEKGMEYCLRDIYSNQSIGCLNEPSICIVKDFSITW